MVEVEILSGEGEWETLLCRNCATNVEQGISNAERRRQRNDFDLTSSYARQSVVFPPSGDGSYLSVQLGRTSECFVAAENWD